MSERNGSPGCRFCGAPLRLTVVDLGMSPPCQSFVPPQRIREMEPFYPLHVFACERCFLVQLEVFVQPEDIFTDYAYYSAYSTSWVDHARDYVEMISERLELARDDLVVELASNDGYLLQHFVGSGVQILGIDPAANVAEDAEARGVPTLVAFFGRETAQALVDDGKRAKLMIGNNVLAQVPDLNDFVAGVSILLREDGTTTFEFPHLLHLLDRLEYDTIYHEHFSYFSFATIVEIVRAHGLDVYDVEELPTHGGSLRVYVQHEGGPHEVSPAVSELLRREEEEGLRSPESVRAFRGGRQGVEAGSSRSPDPVKARGQASRRLRGARQGQHAAQLLRDSYRSSRLHGRSKPAQAWSLHPWHAHSHLSAGEDRGNAARLHRRPAMEPDRRDLRAARVRAGMGSETGGSHPLCDRSLALGRLTRRCRVRNVCR